MACHISIITYVSSNFAFACTYILYFYIVMGVSHCLNRTLSLSIEDNNVVIGKKKVFLGIVFISAFITFLTVNIRSDH